MAKHALLLLVTFCFISKSLQNLDNNEIEIETNPYKEAADDIRKEQNGLNIGSLLQNALENDGDNMVGNILSQFGKENAGQLLQGLGSMLASQSQKKESQGDNILGTLSDLVSNIQRNVNKEGDVDASNLLEGLGGLLGKKGGNNALGLLQTFSSLINQRDGKNDDAASMIQGVLSSLGNNKEGNEDGGALLMQGIASLFAQGGKQKQGLDPELIGSVLNMFSNQDTDNKPQQKRKSRIDDNFNMEDMLTLASQFFGSNDNSNKDGSFMSLLPSILQTINAFVGPEAEQRAKEHEGHSWTMPPLFEKFHVAFDHFIHSEIGKQTIAAIGAEKSFKVFLDDSGKFNYNRFGELMENLSYRRQWIRKVTDRVADFLKFAAEPKVYKSYLMGGRVFFNSYIKSQGFPKSAMFDPARSVETITAFVNHAAKKYFDVKFSSKEYVKPAVQYFKDLLKLAEQRGTMKSLGNSKELSDKLADTINLEVIEPLARVNRAYRFSKAVPACTRYVLCLVNEENQNEVDSLPGLKKTLYKGSSLLAGWFLSNDTGTPFWTLYTDITENSDCKKLYLDSCNDFHIEELKVTTEYVHNEL